MGQQPSDNGMSDMLTVKDVCSILQVSRWTVHQLVRSGRLGSVKIGSRRLIPRHSLDEFEQVLEEES
jgi:excisionase family DNA binding protein